MNRMSLDFEVTLGKSFKTDIIKLQQLFKRGQINRAANENDRARYTVIRVHNCEEKGNNNEYADFVMNNNDLYIRAFQNNHGFFSFLDFSYPAPNGSIKYTQDTRYGALGPNSTKEDPQCLIDGGKIHSALTNLSHHKLESSLNDAIRKSFRLMLITIAESVRCRSIRDDIDTLINRGGYNNIDYDLWHVMAQAHIWKSVSVSDCGGSVEVVHIDAV